MSWKDDMRLAQSMVGCSVRPLDGGSFTVTGVGVRYDKPAVLGDGVFANPTEVTVLVREDGSVPALRTADPIMKQVFAVIADRGEYTIQQIEHWLDHHNRSPDDLYEYVADAIDKIEDLMNLDTAEDEPTTATEQGLGLVVRYLYRWDGDRVVAASYMAQDLMRGNPREFKAGYTRDNAELAVKDAFEMTEGVSELSDEEIAKIAANLEGWESGREQAKDEALMDEIAEAREGDAS